MKELKKLRELIESDDNLYVAEIADEALGLIDSIDGSSGWPAGNSDTKETAQRMDNGWITAASTPRAQNATNITNADSQTPSAVTNLVATHGSPTIIVTWSAPNPGEFNTASLSYDLRYSSTIFTEAASASWWSAATIVANSSLPNVAEEGTSQNATFDVAFEYGQTLYFALKTQVINITMFNIVMVSEISNIAEVSFPTAVDVDSWAMFGKDQYHTSFVNTVGPGATATTSWEFDVGVGNGISQPVADADGNTYFGVANGSSGKLVKLDKNGLKQWEYLTSFTPGTPAVLSDGTVYFGEINDGVAPLIALNSDGTEKWVYHDSSRVNHITVSSKGEPHFTFTSGTDKLAVLNTDGSLKTPFPKSDSGLSGFAPVVLDDGAIITVSKLSGNQLFTNYSSEGIQLWQLGYTGTNGNTPMNPSYNQSSDTVYSAAGPKLFDIPSGGSVLNSHDVSPWDYSAATTVAISADTLYVGFNNPNPASGSLLYALNKSNLATKWLFQVDGLLNKQLVVDNAGNVYFSTQDGKLYNIDSAGNERWVIETGETSAISPILTKNGLIWGFGNKMARID